MKQRVAGGEGPRWRRLFLPLFGLAVVLAVVGIAALNDANRGSDLASQEPDVPAEDDLGDISFDSECGGTPETVLILCDFGEDGLASVYLRRGGRTYSLVDTSSEPGWYIGVALSPDSRFVALTGAHGAVPTGYFVSKIDLATRNEEWINGTESCWPYGPPSWSPNGEQLSASATRPNGPDATVVVDVDGWTVARDPEQGWPVC